MLKNWSKFQSSVLWLVSHLKLDWYNEGSLFLRLNSFLHLRLDSTPWPHVLIQQAPRVITICITANFHSHPTKDNCVQAYPITSILLWKMFNARFVSFEKRILLSDRCEPSMLTEVSRNTHRNIPHATFAVVHDRIVISNAPDSCPLKNPLAPCILPGPVETGGQQGQFW